MKNYKVISPFRDADGIHKPGDKDVSLSDADAKELIELGAIELLPVAVILDRQEVIIAAIGKMNKDNADLWLKDGKPDTNAIAEVAGWPVLAAERDAAWAIVTAEAPAA
jgi:hypothetical protein